MSEPVVTETTDQRVRRWLDQAFACHLDRCPDLVDLCLRYASAAQYEADHVIRWEVDDA